MNRKLLTAVVLAAGPLMWGSPAQAVIIGLGPSTSGSVALDYVSNTAGTSTFTATWTNPVAGSGYSFNGVGPLTFTCATATCAGTGAAFSSGAGGMLALSPPLLTPSQTGAITWTLFDGDGTGYTFNFRTTLDGGAMLDDLTLDATGAVPANFTALLAAGPGTIVSLRPISSGEVGVGVPEPASLTLLGSALVGLGWFGRRRRRTAV